MTHTIVEYERIGFRPAEILGLLESHGIPFDLGGRSADDTPVAFPEWKRVMSWEPNLPISDWVFAIINVDPYESGFLPDDLQSDFSRYEDLLCRAIARRELAATETTTKRNEKTWQITAQAFHAWCEAKEITYPLPQYEKTVSPSAVPVQPLAGRWPWGDHSTRALELLADAAKQWWSTYDLGEPNTAPTNSEVVEYLIAKGASTKLAESIASILRADDLPTGRRKGNTD